MSWRRSTVASNETLTDTEVWEYSLPSSGVLNACLFELRVTNGATSNLDNSVEQTINRIRLIDGSRVLLDVTGTQAQLLSVLNSKSEPRSVISEGADDVQTYNALLLFGMGLFDNEVGVDLGKLKNPKLQVDFDLTVVRAAGATGFVTGTGRISAVILINDGQNVPTPTGFVKSHQIKQWTTAASGEEVTQAPIDGPWLRVIARAHLANNNPDDVLTNLRITFDSGLFVAIDEVTRWAADAIGLFLGRVARFAFTLFRADTDTRDLRHGGIESIVAEPLLDTDDVKPSLFEAGRPTLNVNIMAVGTTQTTDGDIFMTVWAYAPYMSMVWDFVPQGNLEVEGFKRGDIIFTQAVSAAAASIVLQQLMANEVIGG